MPNPTTVTVPTITPEEQVQAATAAAAHAKARFLAGFVDEAEELAERALAIARQVDAAAATGLQSFLDKVRAHLPGGSPPAPAAGRLDRRLQPNEPPAEVPE